MSKHSIKDILKEIEAGFGRARTHVNSIKSRKHPTVMSIAKVERNLDELEKKARAFFETAVRGKVLDVFGAPSVYIRNHLNEDVSLSITWQEEDDSTTFEIPLSGKEIEVHVVYTVKVRSLDEYINQYFASTKPVF